VGYIALVFTSSAVIVGLLAAWSWQFLGLAAGGAATLGLSLVGSWILPLLAIPAAFVDVRVPVATTSITVADLVVLAASIGVAAHLDWQLDRRLTKVLIALAVYEFALVLAAMANPGLGGALEIAHRATIVGGSLIIGAYLAQKGKADLAVVLLIAIAAIVGIVATSDSLFNSLQFGRLQFGSPFGLNKNYAGSLLSSALLASFAFRPAAARVAWLVRLGQLLMFVGLLATQSRGALTALAVGVLVFSLLTRRYRIPVLFACVVAIPILLSNIDADLLRDPVTGSVATHVHVASQALAAWQRTPLLGNGLRFFEAPTSSLLYDPHNVILLTLAESGVIGLVGLATLLMITSLQLSQSRAPLFMAALALLVARFTHGMVDIYWVHGSQEIPWLVVGLALGGGAATATARTAKAGAESIPLDPVATS
jgi:hypothetical protein